MALFGAFPGEPPERLHDLVDVRCAPMRILAAINPPEAIHRILDCLGLPTRPPPIAAASTAAPYFS